MKEKHEAAQILDRYLAELRGLSYRELADRMRDQPNVAFETVGPSGKDYQVEQEIRWDSKREENIRVILSIDDGSFSSSLFPLTRSFIKAADDSLVGESS